MTASLPKMKEFLNRVAGGEVLSESDAEQVFGIIMSGDATPTQIGAFLMGLRVRGEAISEITGAAKAMRARATTIEAPGGAVDTCGTGGDAAGTYNISTASAFVVAGAGVPVAKHGNRALSSKSGSADVLTALGVKIDADVDVVKDAMFEANVGFMMAPRYHSAMRHVAGPRIEMGIRTIFNILGPLANPAKTKRQVVGVFSERWLRPLAEVLGKLGAEKAWVVHGHDGLDELTTTSHSFIAEYNKGEVKTFEITPESLGLQRAKPEDLKGGDAHHNAAAMRAVLGGEKGPHRDIVLLNAAAALVVADKAPDLKQGIELAAQSIDSGKARAALDKLISISHRNQWQ